MEKLKEDRGITEDLDLAAQDMQELVSIFRSIIRKTGRPIPQDPYQQLYMAIEAVFASWNGKRALRLPPRIQNHNQNSQRHRRQRANHGV